MMTNEELGLIRTQADVNRKILTALEGLTRQSECLARLSGTLLSMIQIMNGEAPEPEAARELSDQARREIEELRRLYGASDPN